MSKRVLLQGNEACVEGALVAGLGFFAGYPITPSTEIAEKLALKLPLIGGKFIQMEDEIASMAAIIGASMTGLKSMTATSGPGFSLKQENIGYAMMTEIPCVVVNVQRLGPSTGGPTLPAQGDVMQTRWGTHGDHPAVVLVPATVKEVFELTIDCFNIAEELRTPVILLMDEIVAHMRENIVMPEESDLNIINRRITTKSTEDFEPYQIEENGIPEIPPLGEGYRYHTTGLMHDHTGFPNNKPEIIDNLIRRLHNKVYTREKSYLKYKEFMTEDAEIILIAYGATARSAKDAIKILRDQSIKVGLLQMQTIWPLPIKTIKNFCKGKMIYVIELNLGQIVHEIKAIMDEEVRGINQVNGELILPESIATRVKEDL